MFTIPTTIVLGAGASVGYGYPLGHDLVDKMVSICNEIKTNADHRYRMIRGLADKLQRQLMFYDPVSIDAFLTHYSHDPDLVSCAKHVITHVLVKAADRERYKRQHPTPGQPNNAWYRFLWNALTAGMTAKNLADPSIPLNVNIVSFNYDPSLEYFLHSRVTDADSMFTKDQMGPFMEKVSKSIFHVYGCIMGYKWRGGPDEDTIFDRMNEHEEFALIQRNCSRIMLINERSDNDYAKMKEAIATARQVIFLGFAFDETNIGPQVLDLRETLAPRSGTPRKSGRMPMIKYTNYGDSRIINQKLMDLTAHHRKSYVDVNDVLIKSTKTVYKAVSEDFSLHSLY